MKILALIIAVAAIYWIVRTLARSGQANVSTAVPPHRDTVQCKYCGLHVPLDEAVGQDDQFYCSHEHQRLADSHDNSD